MGARHAQGHAQPARSPGRDEGPETSPPCATIHAAVLTRVGRLTVKMAGEAREAVARRAPPRLLGDTSVPGDRTHPPQLVVEHRAANRRPIPALPGAPPAGAWPRGMGGGPAARVRGARREGRVLRLSQWPDPGLAQGEASRGGRGWSLRCRRPEAHRLSSSPRGGRRRRESFMVGRRRPLLGLTRGQAVGAGECA